MSIPFNKYHGAGNDFIILDHYDGIHNEPESELIRNICHRRFGAGADGLIILLPSDRNDFRMKFFNSDGFEGSMCGNGGRCIVAFAKKKGLINNQTEFEAIDGTHLAKISEDSNIMLKMQDVKSIESRADGFFLDTGSPHLVLFSDYSNPDGFFMEGKKIRNDRQLFPDGCNVNFIRFRNNIDLDITTYERGVEDITYSCGTGAVASAIAAGVQSGHYHSPVSLYSAGGILKVHYSHSKGIFHNVWLEGPAEFVFKGEFR